MADPLTEALLELYRKTGELGGAGWEEPGSIGPLEDVGLHSVALLEGRMKLGADKWVSESGLGSNNV